MRLLNADRQRNYDADVAIVPFSSRDEFSEENCRRQCLERSSREALAERKAKTQAAEAAEAAIETPPEDSDPVSTRELYTRLKALAPIVVNEGEPIVAGVTFLVKRRNGEKLEPLEGSARLFFHGKDRLQGKPCYAALEVPKGWREAWETSTNSREVPKAYQSCNLYTSNSPGATCSEIVVLTQEETVSALVTAHATFLLAAVHKASGGCLTKKARLLHLLAADYHPDKWAAYAAAPEEGGGVHELAGTIFKIIKKRQSSQYGQQRQEELARKHREEQKQQREQEAAVERVRGRRQGNKRPRTQEDGQRPVSTDVPNPVMSDLRFDMSGFENSFPQGFPSWRRWKF